MPLLRKIVFYAFLLAYLLGCPPVILHVLGYGVQPGASQGLVKTGLFATKEFVIQPDTKITDGRRSLDLEQLQPGAQATVEYMQEDGEHVAQSITVESAVAAPVASLEPQGAAPSAPAPGALPSGPSGGQGGW